MKRIKKKINDFILNNYQELFFSTNHSTTTNGDGSNTSSVAVVPVEFQTKYLTSEDFTENSRILHKATEELKFCDDSDKNHYSPQ